MPAGRGPGHGHLVEPEAAGELAGREAERPGEPLGEMALQRRLPALHGYGEQLPQLPPYDGDHLAALDVAEQILPIEVVTAVIHARVELTSQPRPGRLYRPLAMQKHAVPVLRQGVFAEREDQCPCLLQVVVAQKRL
jgi:hypothetical protein